jgi:hypothetical protein
VSYLGTVNFFSDDDDDDILCLGSIFRRNRNVFSSPLSLYLIKYYGMKTFLRLTKHHAMGTYDEVEV